MAVSPELYKAMQVYLQNVQQLLDDVAEYVPDHRLREPRRLIDHGEAPLGMTQLAWVIHDEDIPVPESVVQRLREYSDVEDDYPDDLERRVL
ncbi:MAG TPA: hypothetical protein VIG71_11015 [Enteractinococcus sp.]